MAIKCDCIVAFHICHSCIQQSEANKKMIVETCCGGVMLLDYCPKCGNRIEGIKKFKNWQRAARKKEVKERIKYYKKEENLSNFMKSVLESYEEELEELKDAKRGTGEGEGK